MKKIYMLFVFTVLLYSAFAQQVPRQMVILEIGTGTWCGFCPGASMGASDLLSNGHNVGVIKYHSGDSFTIPASSARISYYGMTGFPTSKFDGVLTHVGGSSNQSLYPTYLPLYQQRAAIPSSFTIDIAGTSTGNVYNIVLTLEKVAAYTGTDIVVHLVLTESNIPFAWQNQTHVNQATRLMAPDQNGTDLDFSTGDIQTVNLSFTVDAAWIYDLELVAFIQDNTTKEILQGDKVMLDALPAPFFVDFSASQTEFCPVQTVDFTDMSEDATFWEWSFPGGTPSSSTLQNPSVTYSTSGVYNVTLTAGDAVAQNTVTKNNYINVLSVPQAPSTPNGPSALCAAPPPGTYNTNAIPNTLSYEWSLTPENAGTLIPDGTQCVVEWDANFIGNAQLRVRGANDCGNGNWSQNLNISVSLEPGQAGTPTGPEVLCQNPGTIEYSSTGTVNVSDYLWELSPASAGTLAPMWTVCNVEWSPDFTGTATLIITGVNNGCYGEPSEALSILVNAFPEDFEVTGGGILCEGEPGIDVGLDGSESGIDYTLYLDDISTVQTLAGTGSALNFGLQDQEGVYTVKAVNPATSCEVFMNGEVSVSMEFIPGVAAQPDGPVSVFSPENPVSEYTTEGAEHATGFEWEFNPPDVGTIDSHGAQVTVTWDEAFQGEVLIKVRGVNQCGEGEFSEELLVMVDNGVGISDPSLRTLAAVYPNPAQGYVYITPNLDQAVKLKITSLTGKTVHQEIISGSAPVQVALEHLDAGVYLLTLIADQQTQTMRLILQ